MSATRRIGAPDEVKTAALRAVSSGDLHECPDGRTGVYLGSQDKAIGEDIVLHTNERLEITSAAFALVAAGGLCNFSFTAQGAVASGGTNVGRYLEAKALNATTAFIKLNDAGPSA